MVRAGESKIDVEVKYDFLMDCLSDAYYLYREAFNVAFPFIGVNGSYDAEVKEIVAVAKRLIPQLDTIISCLCGSVRDAVDINDPHERMCETDA